MSKFHKLLSKILCNVFAFIFGFVVVGGSIANANALAINAFLGVSTQEVIKDENAVAEKFYDTDYDTVEELRQASEALIEEVMCEGITLLKNDNEALPLSRGANVSFYGATSYYSVVTGCGSSGAVPSVVAQAVSFKDGVEAAGFTVNADLWNWYGQNPKYAMGGSVQSRGNQSQTQKFGLVDANWSALPSSKTNAAEAAIVVFGRNAGENADIPLADMKLSENEISLLVGLKEQKDLGKIQKIVVLINGANPIACDFCSNQAYGVDALLWCGTTATTGAYAVGKILAGEVNPSGRITDTFWYDHTQNPVYANFGDYTYQNGNLLASSGNKADKTYVVYQEGIYNGYRYTETRYEDKVLNAENVGSFDYSKTVAFPFGYGLSYTTFRYSDFSVKANSDSTYTVSVTVKNVGDVAGKESVQVYLQKPYTNYDKANRVEKPSVELVGFTKTRLLEAGESQTVSVVVDEFNFASYDSYGAKTYTIGSSDKNDLYYLTVATDAHKAVNNILAKKGHTVSNSGMDENGNAQMVSAGIYLAFSDTKYATNSVIENNVSNFVAKYDGQIINFGVESITNQFDNADFTLYEGFSTAERSQTYVTRSNWAGTLGQTIVLSATAQLVADQKTQLMEFDDVDYPTYDASNPLNLIDLRNYDDGTLLEYNNPLWDDLLDNLSWDDTVEILRNGLRQTSAAPSVNAPLTYQQNGAVGPVQKYGSNATGNLFEGFAKEKQSGVDEYPSIFPCNCIVAATMNSELVERLGKQIGEECGWCGYAGIYGLGINIHRGALCGRAFEYYSEDGLLTGKIVAVETKGIQSKGVFVILKHAVLNDQETNRHGTCSWANEQTIREIYLAPVKLVVAEGDEMQITGMMTGLNRIGAVWSGAQGFCNTVLRAEFGMNGYIISDFFKKYMSPVSGVFNGNDLPDGQTGMDSSFTVTTDGVTMDFYDYMGGYGQLAWAMRESVHRVLYTVVRSNQMNYFTSDMRIVNVTPAWQKALSAVTVVSAVLFGASVAYVLVNVVFGYIKGKRKPATDEQPATDEVEND